MRWRTAARLVVIVVLAVGLPILIGVLGGGERLRVLVEQSGPWAPLTYVAAKAAATIVAPFSGVPLKAASGALFGLTGGVFYSLFGDVIGGCVCFLAARYVGGSAVERLTGDGRMARLNRVLDRGLGGWRELLFFRVTFPAVYNLLSYAAGSTKIPFRQYLAVTAFGGIIHTSILVTLGASVALSWEVRLAAYAGIAVVSVLALLGVRHLRGVLVRGT
ncbi:MAG: TVP38/TMEM64 family protein [Rubrobacteraceae bacterium]|nr:TVP38/TMEM64 family protein [Rubrobacteraceae bacterium]MBA3615875.1 TVP38/TMEM64 family protein [Rubrobacteraceae bacterium]MDQ3436706.1 VTT domain-containing protein [Actinomycetota bacterium]